MPTIFIVTYHRKTHFPFCGNLMRSHSPALRLLQVPRSSNTLAPWCEELSHWKRPWCWERLKVGGEGEDSGWDGWMASLTRLTWVWASSGSWWWTGRPGVLQSMGSQRVGHDWATGLSDWTTHRKRNSVLSDSAHACANVLSLSTVFKAFFQAQAITQWAGIEENVVVRLVATLPQCVSSPAAAAAAKSFQSCPTLCDPRDGSPPGSPVPGILQARTLEWVAISFSNAWKWKVKMKSLSCNRLLATPWTAAYQAPPSMGVSRQEYWGGVPLPSPVLSPSGMQNSDFSS